MAVTISSFAELMHLEPHGPDTYVGVSPSYPWGRVYGGQVVAQGLLAAIRTVDPAYRLHSVHAYFIRGGDSDEPIRYEVDRIRNGRSFTTRLVVARQSNGAILNLAASFHVDEDQADVQTAKLPEGIPGPDECQTEDWGTLLQRRPVPAEPGSSRRAAWIRVKGPIDDDPVTQICALAYASDDLPTEAASADHPDLAADGHFGENFMGASLDHAVWFLRDAPADDWLLHVFDGQGLLGGRGLAFGHVFTPDGLHVASITQEILLRRVRS
ncbi:MAG: thioesterase family protein [Acidimicrobiia bacterium]|nr:thioesterase family protein [Acidimicrobiia bacterium]MDH5238027.1 thioesterase family protein [Acidimicrobiia bacterium]